MKKMKQKYQKPQLRKVRLDVKTSVLGNCFTSASGNAIGEACSTTPWLCPSDTQK